MRAILRIKLDHLIENRAPFPTLSFSIAPTTILYFILLNAYLASLECKLQEGMGACFFTATLRREEAPWIRSPRTGPREQDKPVPLSPCTEKVGSVL